MTSSYGAYVICTVAGAMMMSLMPDDVIVVLVQVYLTPHVLLLLKVAESGLEPAYHMNTLFLNVHSALKVGRCIH